MQELVLFFVLFWFGVSCVGLVWFVLIRFDVCCFVLFLWLINISHRRSRILFFGSVLGYKMAAI